MVGRRPDSLDCTRTSPGMDRYRIGLWLFRRPCWPAGRLRFTSADGHHIQQSPWYLVVNQCKIMSGGLVGRGRFNSSDRRSSWHDKGGTASAFDGLNGKRWPAGYLGLPSDYTNRLTNKHNICTVVHKLSSRSPTCTCTLSLEHVHAKYAFQ